VHLLFAFPANVARVGVLLNRRLAGRIVIGFIQAPVLPLPGGWLRPLNHNGFNRRFKQFGINPIGRGDNNRERPATPFNGVPKISMPARVAAWGSDSRIE